MFIEKPLKGKSLSEKVYDILCASIRQMTPGNNRLPSEDELARTMGVSRPTIREALKRLSMEGIITSIHGKGTFAHPSVFTAEGRMDLYSDFGLMLQQYAPVEREAECNGYQPPSSLFLRYFGDTYDEIFSYGWLYRMQGLPRLYCQYEFCPKFLIHEVDPDVPIVSLPQFSLRYMPARIDYCIMRPQIASSESVLQKLELESATPLLCWEERIFDIDDNLVGTGMVYVHPTNMELSVVTRLSI